MRIYFLLEKVRQADVQSQFLRFDSQAGRGKKTLTLCIAREVAASFCMMEKYFS